MVTEELYRSTNLLVRTVGGSGGTACVVTFDSFTDNRTLDRRGFGEDFLRDCRVDAIHVIPRDNDWYQYPDIFDAMAVVRAAARRYRRVTAYGSSMGGYAAIRLADMAGAHAVLALSPQFSIDPAIVPWDIRWRDCSLLFRAVWERNLPLPATAEAYVVYDPSDTDRKHVARYRRSLAFDALPIEGAGHPVTGYLAEVGLLQQSILDVAHGCFDPVAFARDALARRMQSAQFVAMQCHHLPRRQMRQRVALMQQAARLAPNNAAIAGRLGIELAWAGRLDESVAEHQRALALEPGQLNILFNYSQSLELGGNVAAALAMMEDVSARSGHAAIYQRRLHALRILVRNGGVAHRGGAWRAGLRWIRAWFPAQLAGMDRR